MRQYQLGYRAGQWKAECDRCGFDFRSGELRLEWTGLRVCTDCFEVRHPQDYLEGKEDRQAPAWTSPPDTVSEPFSNEGGTDVDPATDL